MNITYKGEAKKIELQQEITDETLKNQISIEFGINFNETKIKGFNVIDSKNNQEFLNIDQVILMCSTCNDFHSKTFELIIIYEFPKVNKTSVSINNIDDSSLDSIIENKNQFSGSQKVPENTSLIMHKQSSDIKSNADLKIPTKNDDDSSNDSSSDSYDVTEPMKKSMFSIASQNISRNNLEHKHPDNNKENINNELINLEQKKNTQQSLLSQKKEDNDSISSSEKLEESNAKSEIVEDSKLNNKSIPPTEKVYTPLFEITDCNDGMDRLSTVKSALQFKVRKLSSIIVYLENIPFPLGSCSLFYTLINPENVTNDVVCKYVQGKFKVELEMPDEKLLEEMASKKYINSSEHDSKRPIVNNFASINDKIEEGCAKLSRSLIKQTSVLMSPQASNIKDSPFADKRKNSITNKDQKKYDRKNVFASPAQSGQNNLQFTPQKKNSDNKRLQKSTLKDASGHLKKILGVESEITDSSSNDDNKDVLTEEDTFSNSSDIDTKYSKLNSSLNIIVPNDVNNILNTLLKDKNYIEIFKFLEKYCFFNKEKKNICFKFVNENQGIFDHLVSNCIKGRYGIEELTKKLDLLSSVQDETKSVDNAIISIYKKSIKKTQKNRMKKIDEDSKVFFSAKLDSTKKKKFSFDNCVTISDRKVLKELSIISSDVGSSKNEMIPQKANLSLVSSSDSDDFEFQNKYMDSNEEVWSEKKVSVGKNSISKSIKKPNDEEKIITKEFTQKEPTLIINDFEDKSEEFIRKYMNSPENFLTENDIVKGMAKCFANAKEENQLDTSKVTFNRTIKDFKYNKTIETNLSEIFKDCLYMILGINLEVLMDYFEENTTFNRLINEFGISGNLTTVLSKIENLTRDDDPKIKLFIETQLISSLTAKAIEK